MNHATKCIVELVEAAVEMTAPDFTVFVDYAGHVGHVAVRAYAGGWVDGADPTLNIHGYTDANKNEYQGVTPIGELLPSLRDHHEQYRKSLAPSTDR